MKPAEIRSQKSEVGESDAPDAPVMNLMPLPNEAAFDLRSLISQLCPADVSPFLCALTVGEQHLSRTIEHVSNIEYVRWLDRAAELHADSLGYTRRRLLDDGIMWFVARHEIDYLAEAWRGDEIVIATWVREFKRVKSWRDYALIRPADETVLCRAATLWVLVDLDSRKPMRIPREMINRFVPQT